MTLKHYEQEAYMYQHDLKQLIEQQWWEECKLEINKVRESRHKQVLERQTKKFTKLIEEKLKEKLQEREHSGRISYHDCTKTFEASKPNTNKWVINLSNTPLTEDQESLLKHGPNFAITPQRPPLEEYIKAIETACQSLDAKSAEELRSDVYRVLRHPCQLKPNLSKGEMAAIKQLRADKDRIILTADKGVALVIMERKDYIEKAQQLLQDPNTYQTIPTDPTTKLKSRLISKLKKIKLDTRMEDTTYRRMYPTGAVIPKFYGLPKVHKENTPLRPIVSSIGSVSYGVSKEIARIIKPLVGSTEHHVNNSKEFIEEIKKMKLEEGECITSYDVSALFTSIPIPSALDIINNKLQEDTDLHNRTNMTTHNIIELLDFCLNNTYFIFQGVFYKQTKGAAMGSPVSPIVANIFMEAFESRALATAIHPSKLWRRYVDDTCVLQDQSHKEEFLQHINSVDNAIQFTVEEAKEDGSIPFLDTLITPEQNGTFSIGVYRKPTHTDLYLPWDSNHHLSAKYSVIKTLTHRAHTICSTPKHLEAELKHLEEALGNCKYPKWAIKKVFKQHLLRKEKKQQPTTTNKPLRRSHIVIPYVPGMCESIKNIGKKYGVAVYFKGNRTLKNILVSPKDKDEMANKSSIIYSYCCGEIGCDEEYVGESGRTFGERFKEHLKTPSPIYHHQNIIGHITSMDNFKILGREENNMARTIQEAMFIRVNNPTLNKNIGKYNLPHIWDRILFTIPELKLNK